MDHLCNMNWDSSKSKIESRNIYKILCNSLSLYKKSLDMECRRIRYCFQQSVDVLLNDLVGLNTGSRSEGTNITPCDYHSSIQQSVPSGCFSDTDVMSVWHHVRVLEEGEALPKEFDNYMYCQAERGKHTTDGFRKLRMIYSPERYSENQAMDHNSAQFIFRIIEDGYISSAKFLEILENTERNIPWKHFLRDGFGVKGPSNMVENDGSPADYVGCFYVKTWPKEAESWLTRQTQWPDKQLKDKIKQIGYLLVPTGNSQSQESNLEWRCSFSVAEEILFKAITKFQRYTFLILKVLIKEYLPSHINMDGEKQLLSTYNIKTVFLWCLEDSKLKWEPINMMGIIGHMLDKIIHWIQKESFPHYFIPSVNLFDVNRLHGKKKCIQRVISAIRNDLSNKIRQSQFFRSLLIIGPQHAQVITEHALCLLRYSATGSLTTNLHASLHDKFFNLIQFFYGINFSHIVLLELIICENYDRDLQMEHLYTGPPLHNNLLTEVVPRLLSQYCGCVHLARYCIAKRDGCVLPYNLHKAESLLKDTLHLDPCSGYVKLACLYIATGDFVQAMDKLDVAENNFLYTYKRMSVSARKASGREGIDADIIASDFIQQVFQEWAEGQITSEIIVTWQEYMIVPDLLQFELIHKSLQHIIDVPRLLQEKMVGLDCELEWPPLSMIKLLKFVCAFNSDQTSTNHLKNLVADLLISGLFITVCNDIYSVFNMAAWCYIKIKQYRRASHMMTVAIETISDPLEAEQMQRCAFCHHFMAYVIAQCLIT